MTAAIMAEANAANTLFYQTDRFRAAVFAGQNGQAVNFSAVKPASIAKAQKASKIRRVVGT
jgi:hypothetical protein